MPSVVTEQLKSRSAESAVLSPMVMTFTFTSVVMVMTELLKLHSKEAQPTHSILSQHREETSQLSILKPLTRLTVIHKQTTQFTKD